MVHPERVDVAVVGAGPAGSTAALAALRRCPAARVVLFDAAAFPRDKACGDGIAPHAFDVLSELGVHDAAAGYSPVHLLRLQAPLGTVLEGRTRRPNFVIPRQIFDARLVAAAVDRGAELRHRRIRRVTIRPGYVELDDALRAAVVIAADGASSALRRALGGRHPAQHQAIAVRGYAAAPPGEPAQVITMVREGWPAYAWSFPIGDGRANVGFGVLLSHLTGGRAELRGRLAGLLPAQPAEPGTLRAHHLPFSSARPRQPDGPVLLAGDAAGLVNPLTGEGIYYAVTSGRLAGEAAADAAFGLGRRPGDAGAAYRRALHRLLGSHLRQTSAAARAIRFPTVVDAAFRAAGPSDRLFEELVEVGLGRGTLSPLGAASVAAALVGRGRRRIG